MVKFHGFGGHDKRNCLHDLFHRSRAWQIMLNFNIVLKMTCCTKYMWYSLLTISKWKNVKNILIITFSYSFNFIIKFWAYINKEIAKSFCFYERVALGNSLHTYVFNDISLNSEWSVYCIFRLVFRIFSSWNFAFKLCELKPKLLNFARESCNCDDREQMA